MKSFLAVVVLFVSSSAFAATKASCIVNEMTDDASKNIMYKQLPEFDITRNDCAEANHCQYGSYAYTSVLYPLIEVSVEGNTKGEVFIIITDKGSLNPSKGKLAYTSSSASGTGEVLASYDVTEGDEFPLASGSISVSCKTK
jgi:hypothetical protein